MRTSGKWFFFEKSFESFFLKNLKLSGDTVKSPSSPNRGKLSYSSYFGNFPRRPKRLHFFLCPNFIKKVSDRFLSRKMVSKYAHAGQKKPKIFSKKKIIMSHGNLNLKIAKKNAESTYWSRTKKNQTKKIRYSSVEDLDERKKIDTLIVGISSTKKIQKNTELSFC